MKHPKPMTHNAPGWTLTHENVHYQVFLPGPITEDDGGPDGPVETGRQRTQFIVSATDLDDPSGTTGDGHRGDTLDDALAIFPEAVAKAFQRTIGRA